MRAPLLYVLLPLAAGILLEDRLALQPVWGLCGLAVGVLLAAPRRTRRIGEVLAGLGLGALALALRLHAPVAAAGEEAAALTLLDTPRGRSDSCLLSVYVHGARPGRATLRGKGESCEWLPGQRALARIVLGPPRTRTNPGGPDPRRRLARRGVHATGRVVEEWIAPVDPPPAGPRAHLGALRRSVGEAVDPPGSERRAGPLLRALVMGDQDRLSDDVRSAFAYTGTAHLLAVSGLNVAWVFGMAQHAVFLLLRPLPLVSVQRRRRAAGTVVGVLAAGGYAALAGLGAPALRAATMAAAGAIAVLGGRPGTAWNALLLAALVALAVEPASLFEPSPALSFSAVAGILLWRPEGPVLARLLHCTLAAGLATAPLLPWIGAPLPSGGLAANAAAVPYFNAVVLPPALLAGVVGAAGLPGSERLAALAAAAAELGIRALERMETRDLLASIPHPTLFSVGFALLAFALRGAALRRRPPAPAAALCALGLGVAGGALLPPSRAAELPSLLVLDVGHGDALLLRAGGHAWLVDAGPRTPGFDAGRSVVRPALRAEGVGRLDVLALTHADVDHSGGTVAVLESVDVGELWLPRAMLDTPAALRVREAAAQRGVPVRVVGRGDEGALGPLPVDVLWPARTGRALRTNEASLVLRVGDDGPGCVLLPGDAPAAVERELAPDLGPCAVLKLGHHGSRTSSDPALLARALPWVALASAGLRPRSPLPHPDVRARLRRAGVPLWETSRHGALRVILAAPGPVVLPWHVLELRE